MKPTTRLILIVVILSFVMTLAIVGIAIGLGWQLTLQMIKDALDREQVKVLDAVVAFAVNLLQSKVVWLPVLYKMEPLHKIVVVKTL